MSILSEIKKAVKTNLKGYFSYNKYEKYGNHDPKFGNNIWAYFGQVPVFGLIYLTVLMVLFYIFIHIIIPIHIWRIGGNK